MTYALHPADEFDAFQALIAEGKGIEDVVARFGVSPLTVQRRLKLAALSPKLLALYRDDGINLDQLMALALSDDHAVQEAHWFGLSPWEQAAAAIRRKLTEGEVEAARSGLARFVGIEAYEAAGGVVRRDLFDSDQSRFLGDPALLERLAQAKLEALAVAMRDEGWNWVEARTEFDSHGLRQFSPADYSLRRPTTDERNALTALTRRGHELEQQGAELADHHHGWVDEAEVIGLEEQDIAARQRAIQQGLRLWAPAVKAHAGAIVTLDRQGDVEVIRGLVRAADRRACTVAQRTHACGERGSAAGEAHAAGEPTEPDGADASDTGALATPSPAKPKRAELSDALTRRLAAHRTLAVQCVLSRNVPVAMVTLTHALAQRVLGDDCRRGRPVLQIVAQSAAHALTAAADDLKAGPAWLALHAARDAWLERLPQDRSAWFAWLLGLPTAELHELLALCTALTINALPSNGAQTEAAQLASTLGLDMADWWEPTAEGFLNHVSKAQIVQALQEAGPEAAAEGVNSMKKGELVTAALARLKGKRWLPAPLRASTA